MFSPALSIYKFVTRHFVTWGERILRNRLNNGKEDPNRVNERRGIASADRPDGELIWFHAASVGEVLSIQELIRRLQDEDDGLNFLITTVTVTSAQAIQDRLPDNAIHQFVPLDFQPFVQSFLENWKPDIAVWTESELWPTLLSQTYARKIPMVMLNARMSEKSYRRWRFLPRTAKTLLSLFREIHVQDEATAKHFAGLGLRQNQFKVTGTLKEGSSALPYDSAAHSEFLDSIGQRAVWMAASTHFGEEELAARAHRTVLRRAPRTLLIVVPRHPERGDDIVSEFRKHGWRVSQRSKNEALLPHTEIYVADTLGELGLWYRLAPISFVGGSYVPIGGHNPFEPAALGSAILHGPHVSNFEEIYQRLGAAGACKLIKSPEDLSREVGALLSPDQVAAMAHAAWDVCSSGAQVTDQALALVLENIGVPSR